MAIVKGGVWTNVEDEILKAAISKYGKNQWARISSLLVRKAPKQCKARWYEWLDPGIKKIDWSREEDEKLLHLAKLLPTQWRTIAPIVGRTSTQCLERYQKLLDDAEAAENSELGLSGVGADAAAPTADTVRRLRPGETDPDPETKPAKPDAIDMDEDEKEMLSEARARLANTQGKKAKRKQREKLLEETKRLSVIQKRRDLKAAGINIKLHHRKKGEMDYNADIPFEHKPALGFYDTTEETVANEKERKSVDFKQVEQKRREEAAAAEDRKNQKKRESDAPATSTSQAESLGKLRKAEQLTKRRKLNLPGPQVSDQELEEIVRLGLSSSETQEIADEASGNIASRGLLSQYTAVGSGQVARTPRTPAAHDNINLEARNLRAMTGTQSSLLGAENTPLHGSEHGTGYSGATPRITSMATPNLLEGRSGSETPQNPMSRGATPMRTPRRDNLLLNSRTDYEEENSGGQLTIQDEKTQAKNKAAQLRNQFASLPTPKNDFELELPEDDHEDEAIDVTSDANEDASERDARLKRLQDAENVLARLRQSTVIQRGLPRPMNLNFASLSSQYQELQGPSRWIAEEMTKLILSDALQHPQQGSQVVGGSVIGEIDYESLKAAQLQITKEAGDLTSGSSRFISPDVENKGHIPGMEFYLDNEEAELQLIEKTVPALNSRLQQEASRAAKLEKKTSVVLGGYQNRAKVISGKLKEAGEALQQAYIDLSTYENLKDQEDSAMVTRLEVLQAEVARVERIQSIGQEKYNILTARKEELFRKLQQ